MEKVVIYTDGACSGNPGNGGWGAIIIFQNGQQKELCGSSATITTNNKMELLATIEALKYLKESYQIDLYTDSKYVQLGITDWINKWIKNNWKNSSNKAVENKELWEELLSLTKIHKISFYWVKAHSTNIYNNRVDKLARGMIK
jgi:ribonuclease HI